MLLASNVEIKGVIMKVSRQILTSHQSGTSMQKRLARRIWVETALGLISAALLALTLLMPHWIELLFGSAPDAGDGSAEWQLALSFAAISVVMFGLAGRTWRNHIRLLGSA
jgi:hypothetical protein